MPRFAVQAPVDVTVLRSGVPDKVPGRSVNVCERGVAAVLAGELTTGESVGVELRLAAAGDPLRARAMVRYQDKLRCGLEFLGLTIEQRAAIRAWAKNSKIDADQSAPALATAPSKAEKAPAAGGKGATADLKAPGAGGGGSGTPKSKRRGTGWIFLVIAALAVALFWWKWNRSWEDLESGLKPAQAGAIEKPQTQVPAEVMEKLLIHRVEPTYPAEARQQNIQGVIALDIIVGRDGSVASMHALNGPEILAHAAMDALRWWKFEPYRVNGEPATVETTVAVEFKR